MAMGYSKSEADSLIYSGGLDVRTCQDTQIQNICDDVLNDEDNYPADSYQLSYALTLVDDNGEQYNYSQNMMVTWFQEEMGQSSFDLIFSSEEDARAAADEYKAHLIETTGYKEQLESYKVTVEPQISFTLMDQETGQVKPSSAVVVKRQRIVPLTVLRKQPDNPDQPLRLLPLSSCTGRLRHEPCNRIQR